MNVVDRNTQCNPNQNTPTADQVGQNFLSIAEQLKTNVIDAAHAGDSFNTVERATLASVLEIGHQAMELLIALQGDGDLGRQLQTKEGDLLQSSQEAMTTRVRSIFGEHSFSEFTYAQGKKAKIAVRSISARLSLPKQRWSFLLQEFSQMLGVDQAYDQAMKNIGHILGGKFSVDTAERVNGQLGKAAGEYLNDLPMPEEGTEAKLLVATADCKGVPLVKEDCEKAAAFEATKKNPGNRRMATVTSVYSVDPYQRTAEEVTAALFRDEPEQDSNRKKRPLPKNKNTTAHFPETEKNGDDAKISISGIHVGMAWVMNQILQRRRLGQVLVVLMDGQESLWETIKLHVTFGARTVPILDILHALAYVWEAAALFEQDDLARRKFTRERLLRILGGEVRGVIRGLRLMGTQRKLKGDKLKSLQRICGYLEKNADRMRYDEYLRRGYPIATGVIEGACRHLVKDRMERSGMRWTLEGARSMLNVRAAFQSDHWRSFLDWHMASEIAKTHQHRDLLKDYSPRILAC